MKKKLIKIFNKHADLITDVGDETNIEINALSEEAFIAAINDDVIKLFTIPDVSGSLLVSEYIGKFNLYKDNGKWYTDNEGLICNTDEELISIINKWSE